MHLYELCGNVIVNASLSQSETAQLVTDVLRPLVECFQDNLAKMVSLASTEANVAEDEEPPSLVYAQTLNYAMGYAVLVLTLSLARCSLAGLVICARARVYD